MRTIMDGVKTHADKEVLVWHGLGALRNLTYNNGALPN